MDDSPSFDWDEIKNRINQIRHKVSFEDAQEAFFDPDRVIIEDIGHSTSEERLFCIGKGRAGILTVRFTYRKKVIRIIGAGYWRKGKKRYEKENKI